MENTIMKPIEKPERIYNVIATQFSIARHYGGCTINGVYYHYDQASDTLIREDVFKARVAEAKKAAKAKSNTAQQVFAEF
jgi:hypothetical protein